MTTEMEGTTSAAQRLFDTYELCENILKNLQPMDLLRARGVCRTSSCLAQRSTTLRERLYLLSYQDSDNIWHIDYDWRVKCGGWDRRNVSATPSRASDRCLAEHLVCVYNPLILAKDEAYASRGLLGSLLLQSEFSVNSRPESFIEDGTLFREMHLTQPPITRVVVWMRTFSARGVQGVDEESELRNPGGVRFGEVLDMIQAMTSQKKCRRASWITFPGVLVTLTPSSHLGCTSAIFVPDSFHCIDFDNACNNAKRHAAPSPSVATEDTRSVFDRVFGTYELCENILKHLEPGDLLRARRMCRTTESLVRDSIVLQRKLFFTPTNEPNDTWHVDDASRLVYGPAPKDELAKNTFVCTYNPLIMNVCKDTANTGLQGCLCARDLTCRTYDLKFNPALLTDGSCCRAMFLTQPPTIRVAWWGSGVSGRTEDTAGVRFKDLMNDVDIAAKAQGVESLVELKALSLMFLRDCAVTAEQRLFVERMGVVAQEADPWRLEPKA
ncbi:hypothetical protein LTR56_010222 [Elasticomyces elasticus]|nr:hypothetical protein LTR22_017228 [Elasticomyces elasticus]KAK3643484.1 hypothetical protein LTR56_010222 [Elasticomyces elasticus]KAK4925308.1 hypothetical protein LTR49_007606 [Elasticomyces elasticus]KAK5761321.1 hypothetical protein LTS12_008597 [Elasticomyces elasticus]